MPNKITLKILKPLYLLISLTMLFSKSMPSLSLSFRNFSKLIKKNFSSNMRQLFSNRGRVLSLGVGMISTASIISRSRLQCEGKEDNHINSDKFAGTAMYPPITAYDKGFLKVDKTHTIAYSQYGNPVGKPVLFVHGGPGSLT